MEIIIRNWEKYNPRRDVKSASWFRFDNNFWVDQDFFELDCEDKMVFISILCVASKKYSEKLTINERLFAATLGISTNKVRSSIKKLIEVRAIKDTKCSNNNTIGYERIRTDTNGYETVQDERIRTDTIGYDRIRSDDRVNYESIKSTWNELVKNNEMGNIPKCNSLSDKRKKLIKKTSELYIKTIDEWGHYFMKISGSNFLKGLTSDWKCNFEWAINPNNVLKVIDGNYDNNKKETFQEKSDREENQQFQEIVNEKDLTFI